MYLHAGGHRCLYNAAPAAVGTILINRVAQAFLRALPGHFHQAQLRNGQHMGFGLVPFQTFPDQIVNQLLVFSALHVDEIADDEPANVAQTQLPRDFIRRFKICLSTSRPPLLRPVLTSIATSASVSSITIYPPHLSQTCRWNASSICF